MREAPRRLALHGGLPELTRVPSWVEALARTCALSEKTVFAIELCLEEALSNIIRHGYAGRPGPITIEFAQSGSEFVFTIDDEAPHFEFAKDTLPAPKSLEDLTPGGLGIPLMHRFASRVEWQALPKGNRLTLTFGGTDHGISKQSQEEPYSP